MIELSQEEIKLIKNALNVYTEQVYKNFASNVSSYTMEGIAHYNDTTLTPKIKMSVKLYYRFAEML